VRARAAHCHEHAARSARDVDAAHVAQVAADQPRASPQADEPGRAHPPLRRRLRVRQRKVAGDHRAAVRLLGPFPGQRQVRRVQLRDYPAADEPQVRAQRPPRRARQPRRAPGEPLGGRRVQHHLRHQVQAQRRRVIGELPRRPQQVLRPLPAPRPGLRDHVPGERGRLRRDRRRPPPPDIGGNISTCRIHTALILPGMHRAVGRLRQ